MSPHTSFYPQRQWKGEDNELGSISGEMVQGRSSDFHVEKAICMQPRSPGQSCASQLFGGSSETSRAASLRFSSLGYQLHLLSDRYNLIDTDSEIAVFFRAAFPG